MTPPRFETFGCRLNTYETEVMKELSQDAGDAIVFNTCAVTKEAVRQARQRIRAARKADPDAKIIVTGCAAQIDPDSFAKMGEVDLVLGNSEKLDAQTWENLKAADFLETSERVLVNDIMSATETAGHLIDGFGTRARAYVQVQNGCDHRCTFCIIPFGRGNSRSVAAGIVVEQIKRLVGTGYREVVLTGVDMTSWGADLPGQPKLGNLVQRILKLVPDLERLRISSIDSVEVDDELIDAMGSDHRLMPHLHLSLQAGDNMILKRMKRRHSREDAIAFCEDMRRKRPDIVFGADIIAGFPTETEDMFARSLDLVDECGLTWLHVFPYSEREGTPAARMPQIAKSERKARAKMLRDKGALAVAAHLAQSVGQEAEVLLEAPNMGRTPSFAPVELTKPGKAGSIQRIKLTSANETTLFA